METSQDLSAPSPLLLVQDVTKQFLGLKAVDSVSLSVSKGEIVSIIGPNGAGKTTFFNLLTGQLQPTHGQINFDGKTINSLGAHERARLGMGRTFQISKPLIALNVLENVMIGAFMRESNMERAKEKAISLLRKVGLLQLAPVKAGDLTLSQRRRLEVARALALDPQIMLLDEVMAGLNQSEVSQSIDLLNQLHSEGQTFLIIEHNLKVVRAFSQRVIVLDRGCLIAQGSASEILNSPKVITAYLGEGHKWKRS
jgi:branched-chain amino acid transport system ATP-binding protein